MLTQQASQGQSQASMEQHSCVACCLACIVNGCKLCCNGGAAAASGARHWQRLTSHASCFPCTKTEPQMGGKRGGRGSSLTRGC